MTYTAEQFRAAWESYANLDWAPGTPGALATAVLAIAARVAEPGVIEKSLYDQDFVDGPDVPWQAEAIRSVLLQDKTDG